MHQEIKRLFFGVEVHAPWPDQFPKGRLLNEIQRHMTLAFLGNIPYPPLEEILNDFPKINLKIGQTGYFDSCLALPKRHPNVIAWQAHWYEENSIIAAVHEILSEWLTKHGYSLDQRPWLPHATLCRQPFNPTEWIKDFIPLPFYASSVHLYESMGNLNYQPIWSYPIRAPFEEFSHTADMAFIVRGENLKQLYHNAFTALAFKVPEFIPYYTQTNSLNNIDDIIIALNGIVTRADSEIGTPLKAISFHGEIVQLKDSILQWEMIVDV